MHTAVDIYIKEAFYRAHITKIINMLTSTDLSGKYHKIPIKKGIKISI